MARFSVLALSALLATPAFAAGDVFFSLANTDFVVLLAFLAFIGVLLYFRVPGLVTGMLDKRAEAIQSELDEAKALREEAQTLLADYKRKQKEVQEQADRIVETAKKEATAAAQKAKVDLEASIERRMAAAEDQIQSAEDNAVKEVRDAAVSVAVSAATQVIGQQMGPDAHAAQIDKALAEVDARLH